MAVILETVGLTHSFGRVVAVEDVSVRVQAGEMVGIIGPNGAGKTTFLNIVTGYIKPKRGRTLYQGIDITGLPPREITRKGIARSFQIPQLLSSLNALENVLLALSARTGQSLDFWNSLQRKDWKEEAMDILKRFKLEDYAQRPVSELSEGGRKLLDIALCFALKPGLLLMDEPTSGVSLQDKFPVMDTLVEVLQGSGTTTIFVEHDMDVVRRYAGRVFVFNDGKVVADGEPRDLLSDESIRVAAIGWEP